VALPLSGADSVGEGRHPLEDVVHVRHDVHAVDDQRSALRHAERDVEHRAVLGDVDPVAAEHRLPPLGEPRLLGEVDQEANRLVRRTVLRVVEVEAGAFSGETLATCGVVGEQVTEVELADLCVMLLERTPRRTLAQRGCGRGHRRHRLPPTR
jgi:hypothetical protein